MNQKEKGSLEHNDEEDKNSFSFVSVNEKTKSFQLQMSVVIYFSTFPLSVSHLRSLPQLDWESSFSCIHMWPYVIHFGLVNLLCYWYGYAVALYTYLSDYKPQNSMSQNIKPRSLETLKIGLKMNGKRNALMHSLNK